MTAVFIYTCPKNFVRFWDFLFFDGGFMKKLFSLLLVLNLFVICLSSCVSVTITKNNEPTNTVVGEVKEETHVQETKSPETTKAVETSKTNVTSGNNNNEKVYTIGIGQFAEHPSLDNCRLGIIEGLKEEGFVEGKNLVIKYDNAQTDGSFASQIYSNYKNNNVDLVFAIATPMAQSAYSIFRDTNTPIVFSAVTDPVAANIAGEDKKPVGNITGTSDKLPVKEQIVLIRKMYPDVKRIGILYTTSEVNSISSIKEYELIAGEFGIEIVKQGINENADLPMAVDNLLKKSNGVDVITNITDNTVVASLPIVLEKAKQKNIPVFGSEVEQVKNGCIASMGLEYIELGKQTGHMAAKILKGEEKASEMEYEIIEKASLYINKKTASELGYEFDYDLLTEAVEQFN